MVSYSIYKTHYKKPLTYSVDYLKFQTTLTTSQNYHCCISLKKSWNLATLPTPIPLSTDTKRQPGVIISPQLSELVHLNFKPLIKMIEDDTDRWMNLPVSLITKMTVLPKRTTFNYFSHGLQILQPCTRLIIS